MESERAAFEAWAYRDLDVDLLRDENGDYADTAAERAWAVWRAACQRAVRIVANEAEECMSLAETRNLRRIAARIGDPAPPVPSAAEEGVLLAWLEEKMGEGRGVVTLGLTENGGVGCWLPGEEYDGAKVPEGNDLAEAVRLRMRPAPPTPREGAGSEEGA